MLSSREGEPPEKRETDEITELPKRRKRMGKNRVGFWEEKDRREKGELQVESVESTKDTYATMPIEGKKRLRRGPAQKRSEYWEQRIGREQNSVAPVPLNDGLYNALTPEIVAQRRKESQINEQSQKEREELEKGREALSEQRTERKKQQRSRNREPVDTDAIEKLNSERKKLRAEWKKSRPQWTRQPVSDREYKVSPSEVLEQFEKNMRDLAALDNRTFPTPIEEESSKKKKPKTSSGDNVPG